MREDRLGTGSRVTRRVAALGMSVGLLLTGSGLTGAAHAAPGKGKTGTLVVKVLKRHTSVAHLKMCAFVDGTQTKASACTRSNGNGIATLRHVTAGSIDLITYKAGGKAGYSVFGITIKPGKVTHYTIQLHQTCNVGCS